MDYCKSVNKIKLVKMLQELVESESKACSKHQRELFILAQILKSVLIFNLIIYCFVRLIMLIIPRLEMHQTVQSKSLNKVQ